MKIKKGRSGVLFLDLSFTVQPIFKEKKLVSSSDFYISLLLSKAPVIPYIVEVAKLIIRIKKLITHNFFKI